MSSDPMSNIITLVNGLECALMRQTFLNLQQDENATNEQLVQDSIAWNSYLDLYVKAYNKLHKPVLH